MHVLEHRMRNCQQVKDELASKTWLPNQCFEVARAIKKKNVMIERTNRQTSRPLCREHTVVIGAGL